MEIALTCLIVCLALYFFITEKFSVDLTALIILCLLIIFGLISVEDSLSGFSSPATITVAAMFVLSGALRRTGLVNFLGSKIINFAEKPKIFTLVITGFIGSISAFINNTAAVAVMLPTILSVCKRKNLSPGKYLIPLSYASQFGGVCTLIGTSTNLLVSSIALANGYGEFSIFEFTSLGLIMFIAGTLYFLFFGDYVLPKDKQSNLQDQYELGDYITELRIKNDSSLIDKNLIESNLGKNFDVSVLEIYREKIPRGANPKMKLKAGDILLMRCNVDQIIHLQQSLKLESAPDYKFSQENLKEHDKVLLEVVIPPNSNLRGKTLTDLNFQKRYNAIVIAIRRRNMILHSKMKDVHIRTGDELLLMLPKEESNWLEKNANLIVLKELSELQVNTSKLLTSLGIIVAVVGLAALGILPILHSAIIGCVAMILTKCISIEESYQAIDWKVIMLLAGILPLGIALEQSGALDVLVETVLKFFDGLGPAAFLAGLYLVTAILTESISNNAAAVLLAPLAISTAESLGVSPKPFLVAVCFAASTSFATPVGYQTNTMIYSPGNYCFKDFMRAGIPLNIIFWILAVIFIPVFWEF